jgi:hypothetical protein
MCQLRLQLYEHTHPTLNTKSETTSDRWHISMCAGLNAAITGDEPRKLFAISLTVVSRYPCAAAAGTNGVWTQPKQYKCSMEG